jgi:ribonuclease BN (tRNA processing enzyme)
MELKWLGRGSAFNTKEGNTSAYIKQDNELVLIDCGENIFERILKKKLLDDVKKVHILITHLDSDHVGSLSSLIYYCYYCKKIVADVYFPRVDLCELLKIQGHEEGKDYNYYYNFTKNIEDDFVSINSISPIKTNHIKTLNCFGYLIQFNNNKVIYYSGDCNKPEIYRETDLETIDEIYHDTCLADYERNVHTSLRLLSESISEKYRHKVYCMHLDCDDVIDKAKELGFNVVEVEK